MAGIRKGTRKRTTQNTSRLNTWTKVELSAQNM